MREIKAIIRPDRLPDVVHALREIPRMPGVTVSVVHGFGRGGPQQPSAASDPFGEAQFIKVETVVPVGLVDQVIERIRRAAHTGRPGDGKLFVIPVEHVMRLSTGERDQEAV
jgi:nitrogen regulatory protein P-II 1